MTDPSDFPRENEGVNAPSSSEDPSPFTQSPGQLLREARERQGLTVEEVATLSRLPRNILEALEQDDFSHLGEPVYARGYYRKYAAILNISETSLIDAYQRLAEPQATSAPPKPLLLPDDLGPSPHRRHRRAGRGGWWRWPVLLCLIILIGLIWHLYSRMRSVPVPLKVGLAESSVHGGHKASANPHKGFALPKNAISVMAAPSAVSTPVKSSKDSVIGAESAVPSGSAANSAPSSDSSSSLATTASTVNGSNDSRDDLTLSFHRTSWVRVEDSTGKILLSGLIVTGKHETLVGKPPYSVFLGNAPGVSIKYKGQDVDLKSYTKPNSTARFAVPKP